MKFYRQFLSLLLVCVLSLGVFSITANAEEVNNTIWLWASPSNNGTTLSAATVYQGQSAEKSYTDLGTSIASNTTGYINLSFQNSDYSPIVKAGETFKFSVSEFYVYVEAWNTAGTSMQSFENKVSDVQFYVRYTDGTYSDRVWVKDAFVLNNKTGYFYLSHSFTAEKDVSQIMFLPYWKYTDFFTTGYKIQNITYEYNNLKISVDKQSEEAGLLGGLLGWVKDIFNTVSSGFANIGTWFAELPGKLWAVISEGLKDLFVPDEEYMTEYSDKWDELLSQRFGAIYQVGTIITDFASRITVADKTNSIDMPLVSLDGAGIPFSFGGYQVQIVPDGFTTIVEILKKIISVVCTFLFVNGLRKRYDEVMGVEQ